MSYLLISVPNQTRAEKAVFAECENATKGLSKDHLFRVPQLKVGTLDTLMALSDDLAKYDTQVGQIAKKIEKTYFDLSKAEDDKKEEGKDKKKEETKQQEVEQLKIGNATARDFVEKFSWNETRYPKRSPLRTLTDLIVKEATKSDDALKKQLAEYNEIRSTYSAIERKDTGSLLVKGLGGLVKEKDLIEKGHLTTLLVVVPRVKGPEFEESYEVVEEQQREKDEAERVRKEAEQKQRAEADKERAEKEKREEKSKRQHEDEDDGEEEKDAGADQEHEEALKKAAEEKAAVDAERKAREDKEREKYKRLPCPVVVPRSAKKIVDDEKDEFVLYRIIVIKEGAEYIKNIFREKRYTVRPYKFDPAEEKAEKQKKTELAQKKKTLWNYLLRWCSTTYAEVFSAWIHLKAIRLYVESVLRYGLPVSFTAMLLEPMRNKEQKLRQELKNTYGKLAGGNVNLSAAENEPDISGLTSGEFYPYVSISLSLTD